MTPLKGARERDQSNSESGGNKANAAVTSRRFHASIERRTISTFSCEIAYSRSPAASRAF
jgi:hypothetical protein